MSDPYAEYAQLVLSPTHLVHPATGRRHIVPRVAGIRTDRTDMQYEHGYYPSDGDTSVELSMHNQIMGRLAAFYADCLAKPEKRRPYYDSSQFAGYLLNAANAKLHSKPRLLFRMAGRALVGRSTRVEWDATNRTTAPTNVIPNRAYVLLGNQPTDSHALLVATSLAGTGLSVLTERGPLLAAPITELMSIFDATELRSATPRR